MKVACYFGTKNLYKDMVSAAKSLAVHSDVDRIYLLIEDDIFPFKIPDYVKIINISKTVPSLFDQNGPNYNSRYKYIGLIRAALTKVFPDLDVILSIDCDTIVIKDVSDLWDIPLDGCYFAASKEPHLSNCCHCLYTNVGVTQKKKKKLREDGKDDELINALNTRKYTFVSQDVLNGFCQGAIREISSEYNACDYTVPTNSPKIIHYAGRRNWRTYDIVDKYREMDWPTKN